MGLLFFCVLPRGNVTFPKSLDRVATLIHKTIQIKWGGDPNPKIDTSFLNLDQARDPGDTGPKFLSGSPPWRYSVYIMIRVATVAVLSRNSDQGRHPGDTLHKLGSGSRPWWHWANILIRVATQSIICINCDQGRDPGGTGPKFCSGSPPWRHAPLKGTLHCERSRLWHHGDDPGGIEPN
jgi:hypothetical protein